MPQPNAPSTPRAGDGADAEAAVGRAQRHWRQQWLDFPTVRARDDGGFDFWHVPADSGVFQVDWPLGEKLARETIAHMQRFPEGSAVLRRILRAMDLDSTVAQGFINHLEEALAHPDLYLGGNATGGVRRI